MSQQELSTLNEDWLKTRTWDLYAGNQVVTTLPQLLYVLRVAQASEDRQREAVRAMVARPAWLAAPAELKRDAEQFLGETKVVFRTSVKDDNPPSAPYGIPQNASMGQPVDDELTEGGVPLEEKAYDPDEPRDEHGRWGSGGAVSDATITPIHGGDLTKPELSDGSIKPAGAHFTAEELQPFVGKNVLIGVDPKFGMPNLTALLLDVRTNPVGNTFVTLRNPTEVGAQVPMQRGAVDIGTLRWQSVQEFQAPEELNDGDETSKAYQGGPGGPWPEPSTQTPEEREAVFTALAKDATRGGRFMNPSLWGSLDIANSGKTPGQYAATRLKDDITTDLTYKDLIFKGQMMSKLLANPKSAASLPKGRNEVQRTIAESARWYLEDSQRQVEYAKDATKVTAWFGDLAKAQATGHDVSSVAGPQLSTHWRAEVDNPDSPNGSSKMDQTGPEMAKAFGAFLESQVSADGTVDRLGGLAGSDFIKHDQVVDAGRQVAATIDNRDDVKTASAKLQAAKEKQTSGGGSGARMDAEANYSNVLQKATIEEVAKARLMGGSLRVQSDKRDLAVRIKDAARVYPKDWVDQNNNVGTITVHGDTERGFHSTDGIHLDPYEDNGGTTAIHELMHQMESTIPGVKNLEAADWRTRTAGQKVHTMPELMPANNYRDDETTIPDKYADPYMGKMYRADSGGVRSFGQATKDSPYEIMSTAMGWMFGGRSNGSVSAVGGRLMGIGAKTPADPDTRALVLGALTQL